MTDLTSSAFRWGGGTGRTIGTTLLVLMLGVGQAAASCDEPSDGNPVAGKKVYETTCIACHGKDGRGVVPGAPDFTKQKGVLAEANATLDDHVKNGFKSPSSPLAMPPKGGNSNLSTQDIKDVVTYLHQEFHCR